MKLARGLAAAAVLLASFAYGASITGTVRGPDGAPFRAAYVEARNAKTHSTVIVFSNTQGRYRIENLAAGDYRVEAHSIGYRSDPMTGVELTANQDASLDWNLQKQPVEWTEIPIYMGFKLFPQGKGRARFVQSCGASCHGFQKMIDVKRDQNGWRQAVQDMRQRIGGLVIGQVKDGQDADDLTSYMATIFGSGPGSLPGSPEDMPGYQDWRSQFSDEALKIVYVMYEMPPGRMAWDANPDRNGDVWLPYFGTVNGVGRLNPATGELKEYLLPEQNRIATRSATMGKDGTEWIVTESEILIKLDPKTGKMQEFKGPAAKGNMNTVRVDPNGILWISGGPYSYRFDPKTGKFTEMHELPATYACNLDKDGEPWFTEANGAGRMFKLDYKTSKVSSWTPPTPGNRRRIQVDPSGTVWFAEYVAGKIGRLDPETGKIQELALPGAQPSPYPVGLDRENYVWYASGIMDTVGRLDPATNQVVEYPPPEVGNGMRELNNDPQGRMWFASPGNNTVGYLYLAK